MSLEKVKYQSAPQAAPQAAPRPIIQIDNTARIEALGQEITSAAETLFNAVSQDPETVEAGIQKLLTQLADQSPLIATNLSALQANLPGATRALRKDALINGTDQLDAIALCQSLVAAQMAASRQIS